MLDVHWKVWRAQSGKPDEYRASYCPAQTNAQNTKRFARKHMPPLGVTREHMWRYYLAAMLHRRCSRERQAEWKLSAKSVRIYLSWVVKQPLLSGFVLVGHHCLRHLMSHRGAHAVQNLVQPHLHLSDRQRARRAEEWKCWWREGGTKKTWKHWDVWHMNSARTLLSIGLNEVINKH